MLFYTYLIRYEPIRDGWLYVLTELAYNLTLFIHLSILQIF